VLPAAAPIRSAWSSRRRSVPARAIIIMLPIQAVACT
jgi:hypothetical protein